MSVQIPPPLPTPPQQQQQPLNDRDARFQEEIKEMLRSLDERTSHRTPQDQAKERHAAWTRMATLIMTTAGVLGIATTALLFSLEHPKVVGSLTRVLKIDDIRHNVEALATSTQQLTKMMGQMEDLVARIAVLESERAISGEPSIRFEPNGHSIDDVAVGSVTRAEFTLTKLRDCGAPTLVMRFRDAEGIVHTILRPSIVDALGRMQELEVRPFPQSFAFTAKIPSDEGVVAGEAQGWIEMGYYPECPNVQVARSPTVDFMIRE